MSMVVHSRKEAIALGLKRYFTGVPCKRGHICERRVSDGCIECGRVTGAEYLSAHRDRINECKRKNRAADPERHRTELREYWRRNRDKLNAKNRSVYANNVEMYRERQRNYYHANLDTKRSYARSSQNARYKRNPAPMKANARRRQAEERLATPAWFGEIDAFVLEEAFSLAALRKAYTGLGWHVDHMIPVASDSACGLHVWNNCQVIPATMNMAKSNKMIFTEPGEWIGVL